MSNFAQTLCTSYDVHIHFIEIVFGEKNCRERRISDCRIVVRSPHARGRVFDSCRATERVCRISHNTSSFLEIPTAFDRQASIADIFLIWSPYNAYFDAKKT